MFFQLQMPLIAFIMIILMIVITSDTAIKFYPYSKVASYLLVPYLLWLCVALSLNGYDLIAILFHHGLSIFSGHITAQIKCNNTIL